MSIRLAIEQWAFWSAVGDDPRRCLPINVAASQLLRAGDVPGGLIPPMHRRRLSTMSRMGVEIALRLGPEVEADYLVFCSRHGEAERSETLIRNIFDGVEVSPTEFSLSVHNATAGVYSIIADTMASSTSIASGTTSFASGWLDAEAFLHVNRSSRVLLIEHDTWLPESLQHFVPRECPPHALALLISLAQEGSGAALDLLPPADSDDCCMGPRFLSWWLSAEPNLTISGEQQGFRWSR
jgi:hypothetical protein